MRIVVVAATSLEIEPLTFKLQCTIDPASRVAHAVYRDHEVDVLITGVGMIATAAWCSRVFARHGYDLALNAGVCGAFDPGLRLGSVVHVVSDRIAELGAEDGERFLTIQEMKLLGRDEFPFTDGQLVNSRVPANAAIATLPSVSGITVNTVHGHEPSIAAVQERFGAQIESMEGAAFMYSCLVHDVPFAQVRAVSNIVERRNRASWKMKEAIDALGVVTTSILDQA